MNIARNRAIENSGSSDIEVLLPKSGGLIFFDSLAIPKDATHPQNAAAFIDYFLRPEVSATLTNEMTYATANKAALENARALGAEDSLIEFEGLTPQMVEALAKDDVKTLEDFATLADWEIAGGWTTQNGQRIKDDGVLEPFNVSLETAQDLVMTARVMLGWVDPTEMESTDEAESTEAEQEAGV